MKKKLRFKDIEEGMVIRYRYFQYGQIKYRLGLVGSKDKNGFNVTWYSEKKTFGQRFKLDAFISSSVLRRPDMVNLEIVKEDEARKFIRKLIEESI